MLFSRSLLVLALSLSMVLIGINAQSGWLYWLAGLLLSALGVSWVVSLCQVRNLTLERRHRHEVGEKEDLRVTLEIRNHGRLARNLLEVIDEDPCNGAARSRPRLKVKRKPLREQFRDPSPPAKESPGENGGRAAFLLTHIDAGGGASVTYSRRGLLRGVYEDWPVFFYSEGVLGLARHTSRTKVDSRLVVLPHYVELGGFPLVDSCLNPHMATLEYASKKGEGMDYCGVREFRAGDPLRHVHWRTTARRGELVVREFERETGTPVVVLVDNRVGSGSRPLRSPLLDAEARLAASMVHYAHYAGHPVTLAAFSGTGLVIYDIPGFNAALEWLAGLEPEDAVPGRQEEALARELLPGCFLCWVAPASALDRDLPAVALPPSCNAALVLVDQSSYGGNGSRGSDTAGAESVVSLLAEAPFPGLHSVSIYREGDDLRTCLEKPLITYGGSTPRAR